MLSVLRPFAMILRLLVTWLVVLVLTPFAASGAGPTGDAPFAAADGAWLEAASTEDAAETHLSVFLIGPCVGKARRTTPELLRRKAPAATSSVLPGPQPVRTHHDNGNRAVGWTALRI